MIFNRIWAMPNLNTFDIKPINQFVKKYLTGISVDPFARNKNWFTYINDINPNTTAQFHLDAEIFLKKLKSKKIFADIIIFDPPYSPRQISECYNGIGLKITMKDTQISSLHKRVRDNIDEIIKNNGRVLSFGWNSIGMGKKRGYEIEEILLVCHGGGHNDTICLCEKKINEL